MHWALAIGRSKEPGVYSADAARRAGYGEGAIRTLNAEALAHRPDLAECERCHGLHRRGLVCDCVQRGVSVAPRYPAVDEPG